MSRSPTRGHHRFPSHDRTHADLGARGLQIDVDDAAIGAAGRREDLGFGLDRSEYGRREALRDAVMHSDGFFESL
jgi:hypothetical protein